MKKPLLIIALCLFILGAKAQTVDSIIDKKDTVKLVPVDVIPEFPGGFMAFIQFVSKNMRKAQYVSGRVVLSFVIEKDGSLSGLAVTKSLGEIEDAEALRIMKKSPNWIPGSTQGKPVRVRYSLPIMFKEDN